MYGCVCVCVCVCLHILSWLPLFINVYISICIVSDAWFSPIQRIYIAMFCVLEEAGVAGPGWLLRVVCSGVAVRQDAVLPGHHGRG